MTALDAANVLSQPRRSGTASSPGCFVPSCGVCGTDKNTLLDMSGDTIRTAIALVRVAFPSFH